MKCHRCGLPLREADYSEGCGVQWCTSIGGSWCQLRQRGEATDIRRLMKLDAQRKGGES